MTGKKTLNAENLIQLGGYFTIKKHVPGNVRLAVSMAIKNERFAIPDAMQQANPGWEQLWQAFPGINNIKPRLLIMSVDIDYDPAQILPQYWDDWVAKETSAGLSAYLDAAIAKLMSLND